MKLDQLVFGYDGGHRLLGGSRTFARESVSGLLSATDADPGDGQSRIAAGIPLPDDDAYAVAVTWSAPEVPRPGAVWSHVLVVSFDDLAAIPDPFLLADLAQRPTAGALSNYTTALNVRLPVDARPALTASVPVDLLTRVLAATYLPDAPRRVEVSDSVLAERMISSVWRAQWPALRGHFWFYTRETAGSSEPANGIVLARRLRGARPTPQDSVPPWLGRLASELHRGQQGPVASFLTNFGPDDRPSKSTVAFLGDLYDAVDSEDVGRVRLLIENRYGEPGAGTRLKHEYFGKGTSRWPVEEHVRLDALLASEIDAWDFEDLEIQSRLSEQIRFAGMFATLTEIHPPGTNQSRSAAAAALAQAGRPADLGAILSWDFRTATVLLGHQTRWLEQSEAWRSMAADDPRLVAAQHELTREMIQAAVRGGCADAVAEVVGVDSVLKNLARVPDVEMAGQLLTSPIWVDAALSSEDNLVVLLAGAAQDERPTDRLLEVLEIRRSAPDELWLRAAARAVGSRKRTKNVLKTTFGPLHRKMTDDTLPEECWADLGKALPSAHDPALRLRQYLVREARSNRWSESDVAAAVRDAGPFTGELLRELDEDDDWLTATVHTVLRTFGLHK